ncbi:hypothetical protein Tco_0666301 [Tanacetum coccineum]
MNYMTMDIFTKGALWDYWKLGSDEFEPTKWKKLPNLEEAKRMIEGEMMIDPDVLTNDIVGFKTYEKYKDEWIYEWNKNVPWVHKKPWTENGSGLSVTGEKMDIVMDETCLELT